MEQAGFLEFSSTHFRLQTPCVVALLINQKRTVAHELGIVETLGNWVCQERIDRSCRPAVRTYFEPAELVPPAGMTGRHFPRLPNCQAVVVDQVSDGVPGYLRPLLLLGGSLLQDGL